MSGRGREVCGFGFSDVDLEDNALVANLAIDVERGDVDGMLVEPRPGEFQVGRAQDWGSSSHQSVGFDKNGRPGGRRRACLPSLNQTGQIHVPLDRRARDRRGELDQIGDQAPKITDWETPSSFFGHWRRFSRTTFSTRG